MGVGLPPIYAIIISIVIYFGIRVFIGRIKKMIERDVGEGICVKSGSKTKIKNVQSVIKKNPKMNDFYMCFILIHA
jgi:hypothetical protein